MFSTMVIRIAWFALSDTSTELDDRMVNLQRSVTSVSHSYNMQNGRKQ